MEKINSSLEKTLCFMIYSALMVLALGLLTSTTLLALSHILMIIPALYFLPKAEYKNFSKSAWVLLAMTVVIVLSVLFNQDIAGKGYKPILKAKYFLFGFISIAPLSWYFKYHYDEKKISWLLYAFCIATTIATLAGLGGTFFGYIPLVNKVVPVGGRNGGLFGMVMNYAHNMSYFLIIISGLILYKDEIKHLVNKKFLVAVFIINLVGLYFSYTRGAWLAFLLGVPFFFFKNNKKVFIMVVMCTILVGAAAYFASGKAVKRADSDQTRILQWKTAAYSFKERPFFGFGFFYFEERVIEIKSRYGLGNLNFASHAHNNFFEMLGSTGGLGLIAFVYWLGFWFREMLWRDDLVARVGVPFIWVFIVGGLTQSTISLGINLFFVMAVFANMVNLNFYRASKRSVDLIN